MSLHLFIFIFFLKGPLSCWTERAEILHGLRNIHCATFDDLKLTRSGQITEQNFDRSPDSVAHHALVQNKGTATLLRRPSGNETFPLPVYHVPSQL